MTKTEQTRLWTWRFKRRLPFRIHVVQTDNGAEFQSQFHWHLEGLDIRHVYIKPRSPHLNGKVERSHRVDDQEFYQLLDRHGVSDDIQLPQQDRAAGRPSTRPAHARLTAAVDAYQLRPAPDQEGLD